MNKIILRFSLLYISFFVGIGTFTSFSQTNAGIPEAISQVYGDATTNFSKAQIDWLLNQLDRSKVQKLERVKGETIPLLSNVSLITKFIPSLQKDDFSNPQSINPLKYGIDFFNPKDQYFRIDGTDYVLFVAGKQ